MYFKIENKNSEVYKRLYELRVEELQMEKDNVNSINEKIGGLKWKHYLGYTGQQNFGRVTEYTGFIFEEPENVNMKIWKRDKEHNEVFIPNLKTKLGKEMKNFLTNELKRHWVFIIYDILNKKHPYGKFIFPYVEIANDIIIMFLDDNIEINDEDIIEITKKEFDTLCLSIKK